jgi:hypothetical protein
MMLSVKKAAALSSPIDGSLAGDAAEILDYLSVSLDDPTDEPDYFALESLLNIEWLLPLLVPEHPSVVGEGQGRLGRFLVAFHTSLPFSEAERAWLLEANSQYKGGPELSIPTFISGQEDRIVAGGVRQVVRGRDLIQRWLAWRREDGEYADEGSLDQARSALAGVIGLLAPKLGLPESYVALHGTEEEHQTPTP